MMFRSHIIFIIEDKIFMQDPIHFTWSVMIKAGVKIFDTLKILNILWV